MAYHATYPRRSEKGFTLLEVMIAIGITAMIGLGSWQVLNAAITSSEKTQVRLEELNKVQKTMLIMARDFTQVIGRSVRDEYGDYRNALDAGSEFYSLELSRVGWRNPMDDKRSDVQRVAYELDGDKLIRHNWMVLDRSQDSETVYRTMLKGVQALSFQFMSDKGSWVDDWPPEEKPTTAVDDPRFMTNQLPKAVKVDIQHKSMGKIYRVFELVQYMPGQVVVEPDNKGADDNPPDDDRS